MKMSNGAAPRCLRLLRRPKFKASKPPVKAIFYSSASALSSKTNTALFRAINVLSSGYGTCLISPVESIKSVLPPFSWFAFIIVFFIRRPRYDAIAVDATVFYVVALCDLIAPWILNHKGVVLGIVPCALCFIRDINATMNA